MRASRPSRAGVLVACLLACALARLPVTAPAAAASADAAFDYRLSPRRLAEGAWVIEGAHDDFAPANGCNIINTGFIETAAGVVVVNTGPSRRYGEQQRAAIARVTARPVVAVLNLNLHPDYFLGNQAYADVPVYAEAATRDGQRREGGAYADNLYRMCGDWMRGTEPRPADQVLPAEGDAAPAWLRELSLVRLAGHTAADLAVVHRASGVLFAGGLVFLDRVPTTPHADLPRWLAALDTLASMPEPGPRGRGGRWLVPSHGRIAADGAGIAQTAAYLRFLDRRFSESAAQGLDLGEVLHLPLPPAFASLGAAATEYPRNVTHLYPRYEARALGGPR